MKITETRMYALEDAIRRLTFNKHWDVYRVYHMEMQKRHCVFGVNWAALGTVSPEETKEFAEGLVWAAGMVSGLNELQLEVVYEEDKQIVNGTAYDQFGDTLQTLLEANDMKAVAEMLTNADNGEI